MATLFRSLVSATSAVELAAAGEADPRTHVLASDPFAPAELVLHAHRCCPRSGEDLGYYTAPQALRLLAAGDSITACMCLAAASLVELAA